MKFTAVLAVAAAAVTVSAQLSAFPPCAVSCLISTPILNCGATDAKCKCEAQAADCNNGKPTQECIQKACPAKADQDKARQASLGTCKEQGIDIGKCLPSEEPSQPPTEPTTPPTEPTDSPTEPTDKPEPPKPTGCIPRYRARKF